MTAGAEKTPWSAFQDRIRSEGRLVFLFSLVANALFLVLPFYILTVYDKVIAGDSIDTLVFVTLIALFLFTIYFVVDACRGAMLSNMGLDMFEKLSAQAASAQIVLRRQGEDSRALDDLMTLKTFFNARYVAPVFDVMFAPVYVLALFFLHVEFGLVACAAGAVIALVAWREYRAAAKHEQAMAEPGRHIARIQQLVRADRHAMQTYPLHRHMADSIRQKLSGAAAPLRRRHTGAAINLSLIRFARIVAQVLTLGLGALLVLEDSISAGVIIATSVLLLRALGPIETMTGMAGALMSARAASRRLLKAISRARTLTGPPPAPAPDAALTVDGVALPGRRRASDPQVRISIPPGALVAVEGAAGAGKTAFFETLAAGALPEGALRLGDVDLGTLSGPARSGLIHMLGPHGVALPGGLQDNLATGAAGLDETVRALSRRPAIAAVARKLEAGKPGCPAASLSPGEVQLVSLARICLVSPRVLLLDRADGPLDAEGAEFLRSIIAALRRGGGIVFLHSTRRELAADADHVLSVGPEGAALRRVGSKQVSASGGVVALEEQRSRLAVAFG